MNQRVFDMARQSGATDEKGSRAEHVFCFTKDELKGFTEFIVRECVGLVNEQLQHNNPNDSLLALKIKEHFGVAE